MESKRRRGLFAYKYLDYFQISRAAPSVVCTYNIQQLSNRPRTCVRTDASECVETERVSQFVHRKKNIARRYGRRV